jgi:putative SOS response-associated peptidase YedK
MCGRYRLSRRKQLIEEHFDTSRGDEDWSPRYNIAPRLESANIVLDGSPINSVPYCSILTRRGRKGRRYSRRDLTHSVMHVEARIAPFG